MILQDPVPVQADFKVGSVVTNLGTTGLTATVEYSNDGGGSWTWTPTSGAGGAPAGYDRTVTDVRWTFGGNLPFAAPDNTGDIGFSVRIQ